MFKKITVKEVINKQLCLGCGLCVSDNITKMIYNKYGFLIPENPELCDENFYKYCPAITIKQNTKKIKKEKIWGNYPYGIKVSNAIDATINYKASSGGTITALLLYLIDFQKIDAILEVRASKKKTSLSEAFLAKNRDDVLQGMGSRYAPCALFENFSAILSKYDRIAVVGKPCDIAGLKQFLLQYPKYNKKIIYTFSMMCMGLPSNLATNELICFLGKDIENIKEIRYRGHGWPGEATVIDKKDQSSSCTYIESWGAILGRQTLFRCKICPDGIGEFADISCGDAWHCKDDEPLFDNKSNGRSFAIARNDKGYELIKEAHKANYINIGEYDIKELPLIQKSQYQRKIHIGLRYFMFKILIEPRIRFNGFYFFSLLTYSNGRDIYKDFRGFISRYWRDYLGKKRR